MINNYYQCSFPTHTDDIIYQYSLHKLLQLASKALQLTVWSYEDGCDIFIGEVLLDLAQAQLDNQVCSSNNYNNTDILCYLDGWLDGCL